MNNVEKRLKIEGRFLWVIFSLIIIAIIFYIYKNLIMAYVTLALWLVVFMILIFYGEKTDDMVYGFSR